MSTEKPKSLLPNGKFNPEYNSWYRSTEAGKAAIKRYNSSDKCKSTRRKRYVEKIKYDPDKYADRILNELRSKNAQLY
jgi:ribonuclease HI